MERLRKYRKSSLLDIEITYRGERFSFNLFEELKVNTDDVNKEIVNQPSYYGFLLLLHKKLTTEFEFLKNRRKSLWGKLYLKAKEMKTESNRVYNDEMAKAYADSHPKYTKLTAKCIQAKDDADVLWSCVKGFEQRGFLIQTLSSNLRKER